MPQHRKYLSRCVPPYFSDTTFQYFQDKTQKFKILCYQFQLEKFGKLLWFIQRGFDGKYTFAP